MGRIHLTSYGLIDEDIMTAVGAWLQRTFLYEVQRLKPYAEPDYAYDEKREQFNSTQILHQLLENCSHEADKFLALTQKDLFIPMLSFVFGQAQLNGNVAVVSLARLYPEFYSFPPNRPLMIARAIKECVHEMGHTFGLVHCVDKTCPMSLSTNISQVDIKGNKFCNDCNIYLQERIQ